MIEFLNWWAESNWRVAFALIILIGLWLLVDTVVVNICNAAARIAQARGKRENTDAQ